MKRDLPRRVYLRHSGFYFVTLAGKWIRLSAEKDGLPAMYRALAALTEREATSDRMPAVIARWLDSKRLEWSEKWATDQERIAKTMSARFVEFTPAEVTTPVCAQYLRAFAAMGRTHNLHRNILGQVLAFAAVEGLREGFNPVDNIAGKSTPGRKRAVSDAEIQAIRAAALARPRNGKALAQMIDLALLTGQRIGDLIRLRWQDVTAEGLRVQQGKTGERLLIEWSPDLRAAIAACERGDRIGFVLQKEAGGPYRYAGIRSAWVRACEKAGVDDLNIHDMRGRAGMDQRDASGLESAKDLLGHRSIKTTEHYVDGKATRKVKPAR